MADNVQVTPGSGPNVAADECVVNSVTVQVQRIKAGFGVDGSYSDPSDTTPFPTYNNAIGNINDGVYSGSGAMSLVGGVKKMIAQFAAGFTMSGSVSMADAEGVKGSFGGITTNPAVQIIRPSDATPYSINDMVANSVTAGSVSMGSILCARVALGSFQIDRCRLYTNHTSGMAGIPFRVRFWSSLPTYTSGDNATYAVATGYSAYLGSYTGAFEQFGDGASAMLQPDSGSACVDLSSGQSIFWDMQTLAVFTPASAKTFTIVPEVKQD